MWLKLVMAVLGSVIYFTTDGAKAVQKLGPGL